MISCQEASLLISQRLDQPIAMMDRLHLRVHFTMCKSCPTLQQKFEMLHWAAKRLTRPYQERDSNATGLSQEAKERIANNLIRK
jgi:hypothetical protein